MTQMDGTQVPQPAPAPAGGGRPGKFTAIAAMRLGSGILNCIWGLSGFMCIYPLLLIPLGVIEILSGANLLKQNPRKPKSFQVICILEIVAIVAGNVASLAVGILSMIFKGDPAVAAYMDALPDETAMPPGAGGPAGPTT